MKENNAKIQEAVQVLKKGGVLLYLSDTIWGLGCDARNEGAVAKIFSIKKREDAKALITLLGSEIELQSYTREVPEVAWDIIEFSENPLTIVYDKVRNIAPNMIAEDGSAAIRIVKGNNTCKKLLEAFRGPLVSTSANISGQAYPKRFSEVSEEIKLTVDYVLNLGENEGDMKPSKIIKLGVNGDYKLIRG